MILSHLLLHFEEVGDEEKAAITRQVSPVAWQNINLSGTYQFASNRKLPDLQEITRPIVGNKSKMKGNPAPQAINCEGCGDLCYFRGENP